MTMPNSDATEERVKRAKSLAVKAVSLLGRSYSSAEREDIQGAVEEAAAIALSDQEAAEQGKGTELWAEWERLRDAYAEDAEEYGRLTDRAQTNPRWEEAASNSASFITDSRTALDAFVRRHIALAEARGAVPEGMAIMSREPSNRALEAGLSGYMKGVLACWQSIYDAEIIATTPRPASSTQAEGRGTP